MCKSTKTATGFKVTVTWGPHPSVTPWVRPLECKASYQLPFEFLISCVGPFLHSYLEEFTKEWEGQRLLKPKAIMGIHPPEKEKSPGEKGAQKLRGGRQEPSAEGRT